MKKIKHTFSWLLLFSLSLVLVACGVSSNASNGPSTVSDQTQEADSNEASEEATDVVVANWSQPLVEQTNLLVEESGAFQNNGINLELVPGTGGGNALTTMLSGHADIAFTDPGAIYNAIDQGEELYIIYNVYPQNVFNVVTLNDSDIQSVEDLKGKTIGVYSRASGTYLNLLVLLHSVGLTEDDVNIIETGVGNFAPLIQKKVDATAATDTALVAAEREGLENPRVFNVRDQLNIPSDYFVVKPETFENDQETLRRFIKAYEESFNWMQENRDEAATRVKEYATDAKDEAFNKEIIDLRIDASLDEDGKLGVMDVETLQKGADAYYDLGIIDHKLNMEDYVHDLGDES